MGAPRPQGPTNVLDLTARQIESIEDAIGTPMVGWRGISQGRLFRYIVAELDGGEPGDYIDTPMGELAARISMDDEGKPPAGQPEPSSQG